MTSLRTALAVSALASAFVATGCGLSLEANFSDDAATNIDASLEGLDAAGLDASTEEPDDATAPVEEDAADRDADETDAGTDAGGHCASDSDCTEWNPEPVCGTWSCSASTRGDGCVLAEGCGVGETCSASGCVPVVGCSGSTECVAEVDGPTCFVPGCVDGTCTTTRFECPSVDCRDVSCVFSGGAAGCEYGSLECLVELGRPCLYDGDCGSGQCTDVGACQLCTRSCTADADCLGLATCDAGACIPVGAMVACAIAG